MLDNYTDRAKQIQAKYRSDRAAILADKALSDIGKSQQLEALDAQRRGQVEALKAEAQAAIKRRRGATELQLRLEGEKHLEARRKLLGDAVLADMYRREIEILDAADIANAYQAAPTEWEKQVIAGYGLPVLQMRARSSPTTELLQALEVLNQADPEPVRKAATELRELDDAVMRLSELDREAHNQDLADRMGVNAQYME